MDPTYIRHATVAHANQILESLSRQQHLHPHQSLTEAIAHAAGKIGFCAGAGEQALNWLGLDGTRSIGRLRRTELTQLAQSIDRFWRQSVQVAQSAR